jgi:CelD/BcsL family acetyltransferase involved in cellulose biosynthesis
MNLNLEDIEIGEKKISEETELSVERIATQERLGSLEDEWVSLSNEISGLPLFLTFEWVNVWWRHFGSQGELYLLTARDAQGELIALAPWRLRRSLGRLGIRRVSFLGSGIAFPVHLDLIARPGAEAAASAAFLAYLDAHRSDWDCLDLRGLSSRSALLPVLRQAPGRLREAAPTACPYMPLAENWESFQKEAMSSNLRRNLGRLQRNLDREHPDQAHIQLASEPEEVERVLGALKEFHQRRWSEKGFSTSLDNQTFVAFLQDIALMAWEKGWLRAMEMSVAGKPVAVNVCFMKGKTLYGYQKGFDPDWSRFSPGQLLQAELIHGSIEEGAFELDMLVGEAHKDIWPAEVRYDANLTYCIDWKGRVWLTASSIFERLQLAASKFLPKFVKRRLERLISAIGR